MVNVKQVAEITGAEIRGREELVLSRIKHYKYAEKGDLTFASDQDDLENILQSQADCVMTQKDVPADYPKTALIVKNLKESLTLTYNVLLPISYEYEGIHPTALISDEAKIARDVHVGAYTVIDKGTVLSEGVRVETGCNIGKNVFIGSGSVIKSNVTLYDNCRIGKNVTIHSSCVIGADGFGYIPEKGKILKVPQLAGVVIKDNVEIGANTCIDSGTFTDTTIGENAKIDNLVQIAHNVQIGKNAFIAAQTGIAGSSMLGDNVMLGGQVGVSDHVVIPENVKVAAQSGVSGKMHPGETYFGFPIRGIAEARRLHGLLSLLLRNAKKIKKMLRDLPKE